MMRERRLKEQTMPAAPWPPAPGFAYRFRLGKNWQSGKLDRSNAQDLDCVLYFGNINVLLMMIEEPVGA
jgi:hypothetical protein